MPKYRGDSEDWLDSSESRRRTPRARAAEPASLYSSDVMVNARVTEVFPDRCQVQVVGESHRRLCTYRRSLFQRKGVFRSPVSVGDWVQVQLLGSQDGVVEKIQEPRNRFQRLAPGEELGKQIHVLASNIDLVAIVASALQPRFVPGIVDRMILAASLFSIPVALVVTKTDLVTDQDARPWLDFREIVDGFHEVSVLKGEGIQGLVADLWGRSTVFSGHSGVGKTSLLRRILGKDIGKIGSVNPNTGKGRHTTTSSILYSMEAGDGRSAVLIDTPGIREFDLAGITPDRLVRYAERALPIVREKGWEFCQKNIDDLPMEGVQYERLRGLVKIWKEQQES